jgi:molybdopterin molybdotransferase
MISIERGLEIVNSVAAEQAQADWMPVESVPLTDALHRILRETVVSDADSPPFDKAIRDGYAVRFEDVQQVPAVLEVTGESRAGAAARVAIGAGQCCEIMTGALLPAGASAVVMVEHSERLSAQSVRLLRAVRQTEGLLRQGAEVRNGERLLESGHSIRLADIGLLAGAGRASVAVSKRPRVAILATGDELDDLTASPRPGHIRNSNSYTLFSQCRSAGADPVLLGIAGDNVEELRQRIARGLEYDILLVSGGVSMGKYDLVEDVFAEFGVEVFFDKVAMKPGKPTVFGFTGRTFVFGLPGNPISTMVAFHIFVRPVIMSLLKVAGVEPDMLEATLEAPAKCDRERASLLPAHVRFAGGMYRIATAAWKGSSDLFGLSKANALIVIPRREGSLQTGETAQFLFME